MVPSAIAAPSLAGVADPARIAAPGKLGRKAGPLDCDRCDGAGPLFIAATSRPTEQGDSRLTRVPSAILAAVLSSHQPYVPWNWKWSAFRADIFAAPPHGLCPSAAAVPDRDPHSLRRPDTTMLPAR